MEKLKTWFNKLRKKPILFAVIIGAVFTLFYFLYTKFFSTTEEEEEEEDTSEQKLQTMVYQPSGSSSDTSDSSDTTSELSSLIDSQSNIMENYMVSQNSAMSEFMSGVSEVMVGIVNTNESLNNSMQELQKEINNKQATTEILNISSDGEQTKTVVNPTGNSVISTRSVGTDEYDSDGIPVYIGDNRTTEQKLANSKQIQTVNGATWSVDAGGYVKNGKVVSTTPVFDSGDNDNDNDKTTTKKKTTNISKSEIESKMRYSGL